MVKPATDNVRSTKRSSNRKYKKPPQVEKLFKEGEKHPYRWQTIDLIFYLGNTTLETAKNKANGTVTHELLILKKEHTLPIHYRKQRQWILHQSYSTQTIATVARKKVNDNLSLLWLTQVEILGKVILVYKYENTSTPPTPVPPTVKPIRPLNSRLKSVGDQWYERSYIESSRIYFPSQGSSLYASWYQDSRQRMVIFSSICVLNEAGTFTQLSENKPIPEQDIAI